MDKYKINYFDWALLFFILGAAAIGISYFWFFGNSTVLAESMFAVSFMAMVVGFISMAGPLPKDAAIGSMVGMVMSFILLSGFGIETTRVADFKYTITCAEETLGRKPLITAGFPTTDLDKMRSWAVANKALMADVAGGDCDKQQVAEFLMSAKAIGFDSRFVRENGIVRERDRNELWAFTIAKTK